jgi:hypothetical protein
LKINSLKVCLKRKGRSIGFSTNYMMLTSKIELISGKKLRQTILRMGHQLTYFIKMINLLSNTALK